MNPIAPQKKKRPRKPTQQLKNFAPIAFESTLLIWDEREKKIINWIEKRYQFDIDFELHEHLSRIPIDIMSFEEYERQLPSQKDTTHSLKIIKKQMLVVKDLFNEKFLSLIVKRKNEAEILLDMLEITGSKHRSLMAENTFGEYRTLHEIIHSIETLVNDDYLFRLPRLLDQVITGADKAEKKQPPPKRGRKNTNLEKGIIHKLLHTYTNGTSKKASCDYHRVTGVKSLLYA